jgi:hypothetical protein
LDTNQKLRKAWRFAANIAKLCELLRKEKAPTIAGAKRRGTDWSACMKNRHRVSQVVSSLSAQRAASARY